MSIPCAQACTDPLNLTIDYSDPDGGENIWMSKCYIVEGETLEWDSDEMAWTGPDFTTVCGGYPTLTVHRRLRYGSTSGFILEWVNDSIGVIAKWQNTLKNVSLPNCGVLLYLSYISADCAFADYPCSQHMRASSVTDDGGGESGEVSGWGDPICADTFNCGHCICSNRPWTIDVDPSWWTGCSPGFITPWPSMEYTMTRTGSETCDCFTGSADCGWIGPTRIQGVLYRDWFSLCVIAITVGADAGKCGVVLCSRNNIPGSGGFSSYSSGAINPEDVCGGSVVLNKSSSNCGTGWPATITVRR